MICRNDSKTIPAWVTAHKSWESGAHCPAYKKLSKLDGVLSRLPKLLSGSLAVFCFLEAAGLDSISSLQFCPASVRDTYTQLLLFALEGQSLINLVSFRYFLKLF